MEGRKDRGHQRIHIFRIHTTKERRAGHVRERVKKAVAAMGQIWGIGKRRFGRDWGRRQWLFDKLVWSVLGYRVEIWEWKERERIEALEKRYVRWILGADARMPGYMMREEIQRDNLRGRTGRRAWKFDERLEERRGSDIARKCLEKIKERCRKKRAGSEWEIERRNFFRNRGIEIKEVEGNRRGDNGWFDELEKRDKEGEAKSGKR